MKVIGYFDSEENQSERSHMQSWDSPTIALEEFEIYAKHCTDVQVPHPHAMLYIGEFSHSIEANELPCNTPDYMLVLRDNEVQEIRI